jgi:hypothetical protein
MKTQTILGIVAMILPWVLIIATVIVRGKKLFD